MKKKIVALILSMITVSSLAACTKAQSVENGKKEQVVNIYSERNYDVDKKLFQMFTEETGIKVNVIEGKSDELLERLVREDKDTEADILMTADGGRLALAKDKSILQPITSKVALENIPSNLRDKDNEWLALTSRARVLVYSKDRVNPQQLSTYEDLTSDKWKGKILTRSSTANYNISLMASMISLSGEEKALDWAKGVVNNLAREPKGNDRDQAKAILAGEGDVAIMNTYYIGKMLTSSDGKEKEAAENVAVFFPNQETTGTHINISGMGITKYAKNKENAIKLIEYLTAEKAQKLYTEENFEYPANEKVEPSQLLKSWGTFKAQDLEISELGKYNKKAVELFNMANWK